jgi:hypothetical protein
MPDVALLLRCSYLAGRSEAPVRGRIGDRQKEGATMTRRSRTLTAWLILASALTLAPAGRVAAEDGYQIVTGCLELSAGGHYVLRSSLEHIALQDAGGIDKHLGRTVRVTGQWRDNGDGRRLRVAKIEYVADGCDG